MLFNFLILKQIMLKSTIKNRENFLGNGQQLLNSLVKREISGKTGKIEFKNFGDLLKPIF